MFVRGERVLASGVARGGRTALATTHAVYLPDGAEDHDRVPWHDVLSAAWEPEADLLRFEVVSDGSRERRVLPLDEAGALPETVRERVQSTIVLTRHVPLVDRHGVRIVARRPPGGGALRWHVVADPGVDPDAPELRDAVAAAVAAARSEVEL
jgi:hypothetical protein